ALIVFVIVAMLLRKDVTAPNWPFCARCRQLRTRRLLVGLGLLVLSVVMFVVSFALASGARSGTREWGVPVGLLVAWVSFLVGMVIALRSALPNIAGAQVSRDGMWVLVPRAHPRFTERVTTAVPGHPSYRSPGGGGPP